MGSQHEKKKAHTVTRSFSVISLIYYYMTRIFRTLLPDRLAISLAPEFRLISTVLAMGRVRRHVNSENGYICRHVQNYSRLVFISSWWEIKGEKSINPGRPSFRTFSLPADLSHY